MLKEVYKGAECLSFQPVAKQWILEIIPHRTENYHGENRYCSKIQKCLTCGMYCTSELLNETLQIKPYALDRESRGLT